MKNNFKIIISLLILQSGCSLPKYLPFSENIDVNPYGSRIVLVNKNLPNVSGELISLDSNSIIVLSEKSKICIKQPNIEINRFYLYYARPKQYGWLIPLFTLPTPFIHGAYSVLSLPVGLITTIAVASSDFKYSNKKINFHQLKMFARYPQGIPADIKLTSIE